MTRRRLTLFSLFTLCCCLMWPTYSATVLKFTTADLTRRASKIVHGVVIHKSCHQLGETRQIYTEYKIRVLDGWKSCKAGDIVSFKQLGGQLESRGYYIAGAATYKLNEEVVVFLDKPNTVNGCCFSIGLAQGKYLVEVDPETKTKTVSRQLDKLDFVDPETRQKTSQPRTLKQPLSSLKATVLATLKNAQDN